MSKNFFQLYCAAHNKFPDDVCTLPCSAMISFLFSAILPFSFWELCGIISELPKEVRKMAGVKIVCKNQKVYHEYFVEDKYEAGIELTGTEVKSIRQGTMHLKEAWCQIKDGEMWIKQMHISPYEQGNIFNKDPLRPRRLLMHKREIMNLFGKVKQDGYALIPISVYFKDSRVKVEIGLCKGKKLYDKRDDAAKKDAKRQMDRAMKERNNR